VGLAVWNRTLRKRILQRTAALGESEQRFRQIAGNIHEVFWLTTIDRSNMLYISPGYETVWGRSCESLYQEPLSFINAIHPEDKARLVELIERNRDRDFQIEYRVVRPDGSIRWIRDRAFPIKDESGHYYRLAGIAEDITVSKKTEEELKQLNEELHRLSSHLQNVREEERIQIARNIHDDLGQQLTGLKMDVNWLNKKLATEDEIVKQKINSMIELIDETLKSVRRISSNLRPGILDDFGLIAALEWHSEEVSKRSEIRVNFSAEIAEPDIPVPMESGIFRIYQELITNAVRHANAHIITASLGLKENDLILKVKDDGQGIDPAITGTKKTLGLIGIKERTFALGGKYDLKSEPGKGTEVQISIPLKQLLKLEG
jgi:PAS domain S-box-containing protein